MYVHMLQIMQGHQRDDDIVEDFCDSKQAKSHPLFSQDSKALQILLYFDEIELCNPIGNSKTKHKIGTIYSKWYIWDWLKYVPYFQG